MYPQVTSDEARKVRTDVWLAAQRFKHLAIDIASDNGSNLSSTARNCVFAEGLPGHHRGFRRRLTF
jgi:hypothetical protein